MIDQVTINEDWTKVGTWDLPTTLPGLLWALGVCNKSTAEQAAALEHFVTLPAWIPAPDTLKTQVHGLVALHVPQPPPSVARTLRHMLDRIPSPDTLRTLQFMLDRVPPPNILRTLQYIFKRDWAIWDEEHPYVPHPREIDKPMTDWSKGKPIDPVSGSKVVGGEKITNAWSGGSAMSTFTEPEQEKITTAMTSEWKDNVNFPGQTLSFDTTPEQLLNTYRDVLTESMKDESAVAEGTAWYSDAHDTMSQLSDMSGIDPNILAAGASVLSAGQKWEANVAGITALATAYGHPDYLLSEKDCAKLNSYTMTVPGEKSTVDAEGNKTAVPKFGGEGTFTPGDRLGDVMADPLKGAIVVVGMSGNYGPGLGTMKGWDGVVSAVKLANMNDASKIGTFEVRPGTLALGGAKQRSFYNDIAFPKTGSGPTIDKWMQRVGYVGLPGTPSFRAAGAGSRWDAIESKGPGERAAIRGANVGPYPLHADAIRQIVKEYNADHPGQSSLSSDTAQAIMWSHMQNVYPKGKKPSGW